jgi:transmembrane protein EpsG
MIYWFIFICISIALSYLVTDPEIDIQFRNYNKVLLLLFIFWFSGFRDNLGSDYPTYTDRLLGSAYLNFGIEPTFSVFANIIYYTSLSPVFFFLIMAIVTNYLFIISFFRYNYTFYILIIYLLTPLFFLDTFNAVRAMCAASIFVFSCKYIESKEFFKFLFSILLAFSIHLTAIFLLPFYFIAKLNLNKLVLSLILITSFILGTIIKINFNAFFLKVIPYYSVYTYRDTQHSGSGLLNIIFNLILLLLIYKKQAITTSIKNIIVFNLFFIGIVLSNFMPSFFYISRFAMYFIVFGAIVIPMLIKIFNKKLMKVSIIVLFLLLFSNFLARNINDKTFIPKKMLSIESLIDPR